MITLPSTARDVLLLVARVLIGIVLIAHGWQKFATYGIAGVTASFEKMGVPLPGGLPDALLTPPADAPGDLARRYARTHGPFTTPAFAARYGMTEARAGAILAALATGGAIVDGEFSPGGTRREWIDPDALGAISGRRPRQPNTACCCWRRA